MKRIFGKIQTDAPPTQTVGGVFFWWVRIVQILGNVTLMQFLRVEMMMKKVVRGFFKTLRFALGPVVLVGERLTRPKGIVRPLEQQQQVDAQCRNLALYQFKTCPFCVKVRRSMRRLSLTIELRDAQHDPRHREALLQGGGKIKTPCLRIADAQGHIQWMYESDDIIRYLNQHFA